MKMSEKVDQIFPAIIAAQAEVRHANYDSTNPHFKNKYASLAEVIDTIKPISAQHGLGIMQMPEWRMINDHPHHVLVTLVIHTSAQFIEFEMLLNPVKNDPQGVGSSITYGKRYSEPGLMNIASEEDDDGNAACVAHSIDTIKSRLAKCNDEAAITAVWKSLGINGQHPQREAIIALMTERKNQLKPAANNGKAA